MHKLGRNLAFQSIKSGRASENWDIHDMLQCKSPLLVSQSNRGVRLEYSLERRHWTRAQWNTILWSDETGVTAGLRRMVWVLRKQEEALHPDYILHRLPLNKDAWFRDTSLEDEDGVPRYCGRRTGGK